jgi:hypothetical protein
VFHFTPTSASWLNAVEGFFSVITRRRIRRGAFPIRRQGFVMAPVSVGDLVDLTDQSARSRRSRIDTP